MESSDITSVSFDLTSTVTPSKSKTIKSKDSSSYTELISKKQLEVRLITFTEQNL
jgi:hypothetical protein